MVVTAYGRNKIRDDEIKKNQEQANNSPSYRSAAIKNNWKFYQNLAEICDIIIFRTPFHCLKRLSSIPISSLKQFHWLLKVHTLGT